VECTIPHNVAFGAFQLELYTRRPDGATTAPLRKRKVNAVVIDLWFRQREASDGRHGADIGITELLFALVQVHLIARRPNRNTVSVGPKACECSIAPVGSNGSQRVQI
jgi:hypothetical protein